MLDYQPSKLLRLVLNEEDRLGDKPLYEAIVQKCRELKVAGATVFRGLEGFDEAAEIHRPQVLGHHLPIVIQIVDSSENIQRLVPVLESMMNAGVIAISEVSAVRIQKTADGKSS